MKTNYASFFKFLLRRDMEQKHLAPTELLIIDNLRHLYNVIFGEKSCEASYIASLDCFGRNNLILICSYGLLDSRKQYDFSKSLEECDIK